MAVEAGPLTPPAAKKARTADAPVSDQIELRIAALEKSSSTATVEAVQQLNDKVRGLALHQLSEQLLILTLDELAKLPRQSGHVDADTYEELARQATRHQGRLDIASLCLSVMGGKVADVITKAISKCIKEKQVDAKLDTSVSKVEEGQRREVPPFTTCTPLPICAIPPLLCLSTPAVCRYNV